METRVEIPGENVASQQPNFSDEVLKGRHHGEAVIGQGARARAGPFEANAMRTSPTQARTRPLLLAALLVFSGMVFVPTASAATVTATELRFEDFDNNGHVDHVRITFSGTGVQTTSIRPADFSISVQGQTAVTATGMESGATSTVVSLAFPESPGLDGGAQTASTVTLSATHGLKASAGADTIAANPFASSTKVDFVRPLAMAVYGKAGDSVIVVAFSEPVTKASPPLVPADFTLNCGGRTMDAVGGTAPTAIYSLKLNTALSDPVGTCTVTVSAALQDTATTPNVVMTPTALQVKGPTLKYVHANRGDKTVVVDFEGPVTSVSGGITPITGTSGQFNGFVTAAPAAYTNRALLTSTNAPNDADLTAPSYVHAGVSVLGVQGPTVSSITPAQTPAVNHQVALTDSVAASDDKIGNPFPTAFAAMDLYQGAGRTGTVGSDGCIDTIRVTFNDDILDTSIGTAPALGDVDSVTLGSQTGWRFFFTGESAARSPTSFQSIDANDAFTSTANDPVIYLYLDPGAPCDTSSKLRSDATPLVSWCDTLDAFGFTGGTATCNASPITDRATNVLRAPHAGPNIVRLFPSTDAAAPIVLEARSVDSNTNGKVDQILVTFSEPINDGAFVVSEWAVKDETGNTYTITAVNTGATPNDDNIRIQVAEKATPDTGMIPDVAYVSGPTRIKDRTTPGINLANVPFTGTGSILSGREKDGAAPVLITLTGTQGSNAATATFSELIAPDCVYNSAASPVAVADKRITPCLGFAGGSVVATGEADVGAVVVALTNGKYVDNNPTNTAWDTAECVYIGAGATVAIGDTRITPCATYRAMSVVATGDSDIGGTLITTGFTPKFRDVNGDGAVTRVNVPAFVYRNNNAPGVTGIASASADTGDIQGRRVLLTLNNGGSPPGLTSADMTGGTRDCIQFASTFTDAAGNKARPQFDESPTTAGTTCIGFTAASGPTVSAIETVDSDKDGSVDALRVTLSGSINDEFGATNTWDVKYGTISQTVNKVVTGGYAAGTTVTSTDMDKALVITPITANNLKYVESTGDSAWSASECLYRKVGTSTPSKVEATDVRITSCMGHRPGTVAGADADVGSDLTTVPNARGPTTTYSDGQCAYQSSSATTAETAVRITPCANTGGASPANTAACRGELSTAAPGDHIFFVCFQEQLGGDGKLLPNTAIKPTLTYSGSSVREPSPGTSPLGSFVDSASTDGAPPVLIRASANPGSNSATLRFSEFIVGTGGSNIGPGDLVYSNNMSGTDPNCPSGASNVATITTYSAPAGNGALDITITVNGPMSFFDVAGGVTTCPSLSADGIRPSVVSVKEPSSAGGKVAVPNGKYVQGIVPFTDNGKPTIQAAGFVDVNGDGVVDAVQVRFSEFIKDAASGYGADQDSGSALSEWTVLAGTTPLKVVRITSGASLGTSEKCRDATHKQIVPTTQDPLNPLASADDDYIFLCLEDAQGAPQTTFGLGTGITGTLAYGDLGTRIADRATPAHTLDDVSGITVSDLARPVILCTNLQTSPASSCSDLSKTMPETADQDGDGKIDGIKVTFSENVKDSTFVLSDWAVSGKTVTGLSSGTADDATVWITFAEGPNPDTGLGSSPSQTAPNPAPPRLTYSDSGSFTDLANNKARGVLTLQTRDGAPPVLIQVQATVGSDLVTVGFSEPVRGTGTNGVIGTNDISYQNNAAGGATAVTQVFHNFPDAALTVKLNAQVTQEDLQQDKLVFITAGIFSLDDDDARSTAPPNPNTSQFPYPLNLATTFGPLNGQIGDTIPPGAISDLVVKAVASGSVTLEWTTPTATDLASFEVYHCPAASGTSCSLTQANFASKTKFTTGLPAPASGTKQTGTVNAGLTDGTEYSFIVVTLDQNSNRASISNVVKATPRAPAAALAAVTDLQVTGTTATSVSISWTAPTPATGQAIASYKIVVSPAGTTLAPAAFEAATATTTVPGTATSATLSGLTTGTAISIQVAAIDDQVPPLTGALASPLSATPQAAATDQSRPAQVTGITAADDGAGKVKLTWNAPADDIGISAYTFMMAPGDCSGSPTFVTVTGTLTPSTPVAAGQTQTATVDVVSGTEYCFSVAARDAVGAGPAGTVAFSSAEPSSGLTSAGLVKAIKDLNNGLKAKYLGPTDGVELTWSKPAAVGGVDPAGYVVWKCKDDVKTASECTQYVKVTEIASADTLTYTDPAGGINDDGTKSGYLVVPYYTPKSLSTGYAGSADELALVPGTDVNPTLASQSANPLSFFTSPLGMAILGAILLLVLLLVLFIIIRARKKRGSGATGAFDEGAEGGDGGEGGEAQWQDAPAEGAQDSWSEGETPAGEPGAEASWDEPAAAEATWDEPAAAAQATWDEPAAAAAPQMNEPAQQTVQQKATDTHYLTCPQCATVFRAKGVRPFVAQCPNCSVKGRFN